MRTPEPWRKVITLTEYEFNCFSRWEEVGTRIPPEVLEALDRWKWADLRDLSKALGLEPFEVLKLSVPPAGKQGLLLITPFPVPGNRTQGWIKVFLRPNLEKPIRDTPPPFPFWNREQLGESITHRTGGDLNALYTRPLKSFVNEEYDEHPVMVPRGWADLVLKQHRQYS